MKAQINPGDFVMPYGRHRGEPLSKIPTEYLTIFLRCEDPWPSMKSALLAHLVTRTNGNVRRIERCVDCDDATGRSGRADDSLFCPHCSRGPLCSECYHKHAKDDGKPGSSCPGPLPSCPPVGTAD